jgi:hypothetical protein
LTKDIGVGINRTDNIQQVLQNGPDSPIGLGLVLGPNVDIFIYGEYKGASTSLCLVVLDAASGFS